MGCRNFMRLAAAAVVIPAFAGFAFAGEIWRPAGVVELFTSQGCSSCPPADAVFADIAKEDDVVALAYHVDYWDYLGWRDTMGSADNTARQKDYAKAFKARSVYTPQAVINGRTHVNGASRIAIEAALDDMQTTGDAPSVGISVKRAGESVLIETEEGDGAEQNAHVLLVYFDPPKPVQIERGENNSKTVTYYNPVTSVQTAGMWHGTAARYEMPASEIAKKGEGGCAVLLQSVTDEGLPGPILGATVIRNESQ
ncbi:MAG TPA: DUF1223 domain-containing protein [Rhizobiaceae bacterium]|nr:DUF1223 domain-containing protein [Rhizobiaceae bacterium]